VFALQNYIIDDLIQEDEINSEEDSFSDDDVVCPDEEYVFPSPDEVSNVKPPVVGMVFRTLEEAVRFVNVYAKIYGFSIIKGRNYKSRKITIQCNKSRKTRLKDTIGRKRKRNVIERTDCQMHVRVRVVETKWHVISCSL
jgi:hypothetical protein